jgi:hypothetical protein
MAISEDQRREFRKNEIFLFALTYFKSNLDDALEAFDGDPSAPAFADFPSEMEVQKLLDELSSDVSIERKLTKE